MSQSSKNLALIGTLTSSFSSGYAEDDLQEARQAVLSTPPTLAEPVHAPYAFVTEEHCSKSACQGLHDERDMLGEERQARRRSAAQRSRSSWRRSANASAAKPRRAATLHIDLSSSSRLIPIRALNSTRWHPAA
jgi:hypothetical protein